MVIYAENIPKDVEQINVESIDENSVLKYSDVFSSVHFIKLETQDNSIIGRIEKIIAVGNKFVILDASIAKKVFVFDENGVFLNRVGTLGGGPEEYDCPDDIAYDKYNDELLIWCSNYQSIFKFKLDGTFIRKIKTAWWAPSIVVAAQDTYWLYLNNISQKQGYQKYNILEINEKGEVTGQLLPFNSDTKSLSPPCKNVFTSYQNEIIFSPQYSNRIFTINPNEIKTKYYVNFNKYNIPSSAFINVTDRELTKIIKEREYAFTIGAIETRSHVVCQFVYKRRIFDAYYSKETKATKVSSIYFNDMHAVVSSRNFVYAKGDSLISFVNPQSFIEVRDIIKKIGGNRINLKSVVEKQLSSWDLIFASNVMKKNYAKKILSIDIELTKEEIKFINSIEESDNPILLITTLKKFDP